MSEGYFLRAPHASEFESWFKLYERYAYLMEGSPTTRAVAQTVWNWIHDPQHPTEAIVAFHGEAMTGFTIYRPFPRTLHANDACYLDDLYVVDEHRGSGLARLLIQAVAAVAQQRGWSHVRWVTEERNDRACRLYDKLAEASDLITYRMRPSTGSG